MKLKKQRNETLSEFKLTLAGALYPLLLIFTPMLDDVVKLQSSCLQQFCQCSNVDKPHSVTSEF